MEQASGNTLKFVTIDKKLNMILKEIYPRRLKPEVVKKKKKEKKKKEPLHRHLVILLFST